MTTADVGTAGVGAEVALTPSGDRREFWSRTLRVWTIAFAVGMVLAVIALVLDTPERGRLAVGLAALAVFAAAYGLLGLRGARRGDVRLTYAYLALLVVLTAVVVAVSPIATILLFISYSQIWFFATTRIVGVVLSTALTVLTFGALAWNTGFAPDRIGSIAAQAGVALGFAVLLGLWVTHTVEQSEERAELLERLEAAQAELGRTHHEAGVMAERERVAQEIHDTIAQGLTSVVMLAQTAEADLDRGESAAAAERLRLVEAVARENLAEARALVAAFAPVGLAGSTLGEALHRLGERFAAETSVAVEVELRGDVGAIDRAHEVVLLRVAQEGLSNVRRHAQASRVLVTLDGRDPGLVRLEISDDGVGFDSDHHEGFGLRGMRERAASGGGTLDVTSGPGEGTRVAVQLDRAAGGGSAPR